MLNIVVEPILFVGKRKRAMCNSNCGRSASNENEISDPVPVVLHMEEEGEL